MLVCDVEARCVLLVVVRKGLDESRDGQEQGRSEEGRGLWGNSVSQR